VSSSAVLEVEIVRFVENSSRSYANLVSAVDIPPVISASHKERTVSVSDVLFRVIACVVVGVIGYWYPLWSDYRHFPNDPDSRIGMVFAFSFPFIFIFTLWAWLGVRDFSRRLNQRARLPLVAGVVVLCGAPLLVMGSGIVFGIIQVIIYLLPSSS